MVRLCDVGDRLFDRRLRLALRIAAFAESSAAQSARLRRRSVRSFVQHVDQLHHQHQLAELRRRDDDESSHADARPHTHNFLSAATGLAMAFAMVRAFARSSSTTVGNFWVDMTRVTSTSCCRSRSSSPLPMSRSACRRPCGFGRRDDARRSQADDLDGPDGEPGGDQGARHQRRRVHERQFGASVREPECLDEYHPDLDAAADTGRLRPRLRQGGRRHRARAARSW